MLFDPENKIVQLCTQGMSEEAQGNKAEAKKLFLQAWEIANDDLEACTAAHYVARHQDTPEETLRWNIEALQRAEKLDKERMVTAYPSLYLNVAKSYETLGDNPTAATYYLWASESCSLLPEGPYSEMIQGGVRDGLRRTRQISWQNTELDELISGWCEQKQLKALAAVLPAYMTNLGTEEDINKLISALSYLSAMRTLPEAEQLVVDELIGTCSKQLHEHL